MYKYVTTKNVQWIYLYHTQCTVNDVISTINVKVKVHVNETERKCAHSAGKRNDFVLVPQLTTY